jgi:hypothetical protein
MFNIVRFSSGVKIDLIVRKSSDYGAVEFERRRQGDRLDMPYLRRWANELNLTNLFDKLIEDSSKSA